MTEQLVEIDGGGEPIASPPAASKPRRPRRRSASGRSAGRPRKDGTPAQARKPRQDSVPAAKRDPSAALVRKQLTGLSLPVVKGGNWLAKAKFPMWQAMPLEPKEQVLLAHAIAGEIAQSKRLTELCLKLLKAGPHAELMAVVTAIAMPRLVMTGLLPKEVADAWREMATAAAASVHMETEPTSGDGGTEREREEHSDVPAPTDSPRVRDLPDEAGQSPVSSGHVSGNGFVHDIAASFANPIEAAI